MNYSFEEFFEKNKKNKNKKISGKLWRAYQEIKEKLEKELENSKVYFTHYSSHDKRHSENIIIQFGNRIKRRENKAISTVTTSKIPNRTAPAGDFFVTKKQSLYRLIHLLPALHLPYYQTLRQFLS